MSELQGVQLRDGQSASSLFHRILWQVTQGNFDLEAHVNLSHDPEHFKLQYVEQLPQFEAVRLGAPSRESIATQLHQALLESIVFHSAAGPIPLQEHLIRGAAPAELKSVRGRDSIPWNFRLNYEDKTWRSLRGLSDVLVNKRVMNRAAGEALAWLQDGVISQDGLNLSDRKVVVFGAGAEMASTRLFLEAGADVLWLDIVAPPDDLLDGHFSGSLSWIQSPLDILLQPAETLATIQSYADGEAVDMCLYAYAPGQARELRLTGAMSALVEAMPREQLRTVTMLVSPTTASELDTEDVLDIEKRMRKAPLWEKSLGRLGIMGKPGVASCRNAHVTRTLVRMQGASYQAAQYLGKLVAAEAWHARGFKVSANTAAITQTRSLDHPVFDAAFVGARAMQVETFTPLQSQTLSGLLAIHDWLSYEHSMPGRLRIHGGIHSLPYPLDKALRVAAAIGFAKRPRLLKGLFG